MATLTKKDLLEAIEGMPMDAKIRIWDKERVPHDIDENGISYYSLRKEIDILLC